MPPLMTVTPDPAAGRVFIGIGGGVAPVTITASAPPITYNVRGPIPAVGFVSDYDAPFNTPITYVASDSTGQTPPQTVTLESSTFWLSSMRTPSLSAVQPVVLADREQTWEGRGIAHDVLGSPEPLVTTQVAGYRSGTMEFYAKTVQDFLALRDLLLSGDVILLRSPCPTEISDTAMLVLRMTSDLPWNARPQRPRTVSVEYRSVRRDLGPPRNPTWTFEDIATTYATFSALPPDFPTFDALTLGPPVPATAAVGAVEPRTDPGADLGW